MKVIYNHPALPDGLEVGITGLNVVFRNNEPVDVPKEAIDDFEARTGKKFADIITGPNFKHAHTKSDSKATEESEDK